MTISQDSKQAIRREINILSKKRRLANEQLRKANKAMQDATIVVAEYDQKIAILRSDLQGP